MNRPYWGMLLLLILLLSCRKENLSDKTGASTSNQYPWGETSSGVLILNEGNMSDEHGYLSYIDPNGRIIDSIYLKANGTELGNISQDLFISEGKIYLISKNGRVNQPKRGRMVGDGKLIIADGKTIKREKTFQDELAPLRNPSHLAVVGKDIFIRDSRQIYHFDLSTKMLRPIYGTTGALEQPLLVLSGKVFACGESAVHVINPQTKRVEQDLPLEDGSKLMGITKADPSHLYILGQTMDKVYKVVRVDASDPTNREIRQLEITDWETQGSRSSPLTARGDTIYYTTSAYPRLYRYIFSIGKSTDLSAYLSPIEGMKIRYNNIRLDPTTGYIYESTLADYSSYKTKNSIAVWKDEGDRVSLVREFRGHTRFLANFYFPSDFQ